MRCSLTWTCTRRKKAGLCCAYCPERDSCDDACQNRPDQCLMATASTPREYAADYNIQRVKTVGQFKKIAEAGKPLGLFYVNDRYTYRAMDNRTGTPVVKEKLSDSSAAIMWLVERVEADIETGKEVQYER